MICRLKNSTMWYLGPFAIASMLALWAVHLNKRAPIAENEPNRVIQSVGSEVTVPTHQYHFTKKRVTANHTGN